MDLKAAALQDHPTLLESYFWGWLGGMLEFEDYVEELIITDLRGPGHLPDDSPGEP